MAHRHNKKPKARGLVVLTEVPPGLLDGLPTEDQRAISEVIGKPILLREYDEDGSAVLEFKDRDGTFHTIWVNPDFVRPAD